MAGDTTEAPSRLIRLGHAIGDRLMGLRDRLLTDPSFQRWASHFPLTRPIARRHAAAAFDLCAGFVYSQVLLACVRLGVLEHVRPRPLLEDELAKQIDLPFERARLLIRSAIALDLLSRRSGGRVGLGMLGGAISANPGISAMVEHHALVYSDLSDPVALLAGSRRETRLSDFWGYANNDAAAELGDAHAASYSTLMTRSQTMLASDILDAYPFSRHSKILDVGGGEGEFLLALARRVPGPSLHLFDLPAVASRAAARFEREGFSARLRATGGSFFTDPVPEGHDAISLVRIVHDHDDDKVLALFSKLRLALAPGGTLLVAEPMSDVAGSARVADVYFAFYLLAMGSGRPRSIGELSGMLRAAGFDDVRQIPTARPMLVSMIAARAKS